jgi:hypothetical protein
MLDAIQAYWLESGNSRRAEGWRQLYMFSNAKRHVDVIDSYAPRHPKWAMMTRREQLDWLQVIASPYRVDDAGLNFLSVPSPNELTYERSAIFFIRAVCVLCVAGVALSPPLGYDTPRSVAHDQRNHSGRGATAGSGSSRRPPSWPQGPAKLRELSLARVLAGHFRGERSVPASPPCAPIVTALTRTRLSIPVAASQATSACLRTSVTPRRPTCFLAWHCASLAVFD